MIFDEITLHNFGLYAGSQTVKLTPPSPQKPIVLIGGLNGGGKTTLLDALQLCLFGPHARISNRSTLAYQEYLSRSIHRGTGVSEAAVKINFRHTFEGYEDRYTIYRSWQRSGDGCKEHFEVLKNDVPEPALSDNWAAQVEEFFPANIAHLFLFDGEQVEAYASQQDSSALVGTAIKNLLGLDIVDQLEKDLSVYEHRKRSENKNDSRYAEITTSQNTVHTLRKRLNALKQERAALKTHRIDRLQRTLHEVEDRYRKVGGTLYDQRAYIEQKLTYAKQAVKDGESTLRELSTGSLPLLLTRVLLESAESRDRNEEKCRRARDLFAVLEKRDREAINHMRKQPIDKSTINALIDFFSESRAEQQELGKKETVLNLSAEVRSDLRALLLDDLEDMKIKAMKLLKQQKKLQAARKQVQIEHENIPHTDTIIQIATKRDALKKEGAELEAMYAAMGQDIERLERELKRSEQNLTHLIEDDVKERGHSDDLSRILQHAGKVRTTLTIFRNTVIERHVHRIEQLVLESYKQLLRKSALVTRLSIDPKSFALTLFGRDGKTLSTERLSAGERQLLAVALLWGLAKAAGRPLPTAIDTPLSRLDSGHRMHLVERYLPFASHQVLLLSTDEEIAGEYYKRLSPWIGRIYQLSYDDDSSKTKITPDYFEV